ncbi:MAG: threonylcarbamoyl-AMP synthase [Anaerolineales bacterium]|nr:threonylcarbamoyl-AMP synthase [Anaerolineales bacterium]
MGTIILPAEHPSAISQALKTLRAGDLVAFPTDTVYGLGALICIPESIARLYTTKGRSKQKAIPVLIGDVDDLSQIAIRVPPNARLLAKRFWPGPLTLVVPRHPSLPDILSPTATIGVRMPDHPIALGLLRRSGPLAVSSANISGQPSTATAEEVFEQLGGRISLIIDGGHTPGGSPSTVARCTQTELVILRPGPITEHDLKSVLS